MSSSNLALARMIYSGSCHGAYAHVYEPPALKHGSERAIKYSIVLSTTHRTTPSEGYLQSYR